MKPKYKSPAYHPLTAIAISLAVIPSIHAATDTWDGAASGVWDTVALNWNAGGVFTSGNDALFTGTPANNVTSAAGQTIGAITLDSTFTGSVALTGANTIAGPTTIQAGVLSIADNNNLGASAVTLNGGTLRAAMAAAPITNTRVITVGASGGTIAVGTPTSGTPTFIIGAAGNLAGSGTLTVTGNGSLGMAGSGASVLVMGAANAGFSGNVVIQNGGIIEYVNAGGIASGTFTIDNNGMLSVNNNTIARNVTMNAGAYLAFQNNNNGVFSGNITVNGAANVRMQDWWGNAVRNGRIDGIVSGNGSLAVNSGTGTGGVLELRGANNFSGGVTIQSGGVAGFARTNGTNTNLGSGTVTLNTGGILRPGFAVTSNQNVSTSGNDITLAGGSIFADDAHQYLTGAINVSTSGILGSTYNSGANTAAERDKGLAIGGLVTGSGPLTIQHSRFATGQTYHTSFVSFANSGNTYSGTITINQNTTASEGGVYLGVNAGTALQFASLNISPINGANLKFGTSPVVFKSGIGSATIGSINGSGPLVLTGYDQVSHVYGNSADAIALNVGGNGANTEISGIISGFGSLNKLGVGTLTLAAANTFTGDTRVSEGSLSLTNELAIQNSAFDTSGAGTLVLSSPAPVFGGLKGGSSLASVITGYTNVNELTLNPVNGITHHYSVGIADGAAGMVLVKSGGGTQILSGLNTYTGGTWVDAGTLQFPTPASMSPSSAINVANGATLAVNAGGAGEFGTGTGIGSISGLLAGLGGQSGSTVSYGSGAFVGIDTTNAGSPVVETANISGFDATLVKLGTGTLELAGNNSYGGNTVVSAGTLILSGTNTTSGTTTVNNGATLQYNGSPSMSGTSPLVLGNGGTLSLRSDVDATFSPAAFGNLTAGSSYNILVNGLTGAGTGKTLSIISPAAGGGGTSNTTLNVTSSSDDTLNFTTAFQTNSNNGGAWATTSQNVFNLTGANVVLNGLAMGNNGNGGITVNSTTGNSLTIQGNVATNTNRTTAGIVNSGTLTLNNTVSLAGANQGFFVMLNGGTLNVNNGGAIRNNSAIVGTRSGLAITGGTLDNTSGSAKTLTFNPTLLLNGDFAFSTTGGNSNNNLNLGTGAASLGPNSGTTRTITTNGSATLTIGGAITNGTTADSIIKTGTGTLVFGGANAYTGTTAVNAGSLVINGNSSAATGAVSVASGATLGGNGNLGGNVTIAGGGHHALEVADIPANQVTRAISGILDLSAVNDVLDLSAVSSPADGTYVLVTATGGITGHTGGTLDNTLINFSGVSGTVSVSGSDLLLTVGSGGYGLWADTHAPDQTANEDFDGDGVANGVEYLVGGSSTTNDLGKLPTLSSPGSNLEFTFVRDQDSKTPDVSVSIEVGTSLASWPTSYVVGDDTGGSSSGVTVTDNGNGTETIKLTLTRAPDAAKFARLVVQID